MFYVTPPFSHTSKVDSPKRYELGETVLTGMQIWRLIAATKSEAAVDIRVCSSTCGCIREPARSTFRRVSTAFVHLCSEPKCKRGPRAGG